jgi:hypothetical protein
MNNSMVAPGSEETTHMHKKKNTNPLDKVELTSSMYANNQKTVDDAIKGQPTIIDDTCGKKDTDKIKFDTPDRHPTIIDDPTRKRKCSNNNEQPTPAGKECFHKDIMTRHQFILCLGGFMVMMCTIILLLFVSITLHTPQPYGYPINIGVSETKQATRVWQDVSFPRTDMGQNNWLALSKEQAHNILMYPPRVPIFLGPHVDESWKPKDVACAKSLDNSNEWEAPPLFYGAAFVDWDMNIYAACPASCSNSNVDVLYMDDDMCHYINIPQCIIDECDTTTGECVHRRVLCPNKQCVVDKCSPVTGCVLEQIDCGDGL